jgi:prepilin-type N-terminal cleavage/methylation domain-containing protein
MRFIPLLRIFHDPTPTPTLPLKGRELKYRALALKGRETAVSLPLQGGGQEGDGYLSECSLCSAPPFMGKDQLLKEGWGDLGFTLIEMVVVIVILSIISVITISFLISSVKIYAMSVNQKTLFDEGKLALERMCRDIRDARSITSSTASSITFVRNDATVQDIVGETIIFQRNAGASTLEKVKASPSATSTMAANVFAFTVTNATNEIQLQLTLGLSTGENVTLQTKVYPKCLLEDTAVTPVYKNFRILNTAGNPVSPTWQEVSSP